MLCHYFFLRTRPQQKEHRIVIEVTKGDTASFSIMMRQFNNITIATAGEAKLEVVCYGPGLHMLMTGKTTVQQQIADFSQKYNVVFCRMGSFHAETKDCQKPVIISDCYGSPGNT